MGWVTGVKRMKLNGMTLNPYIALKNGLRLIRKYPTMELRVSMVNLSTIGINLQFDKIYTINYKYDIFYYHYGQRIRFDLTRDLLMLYLLNYQIKCIEIYGSVGLRYINKVLYDYKQSFAETIQRYYRKYRLKKARLRNDLVIRGLMEYFYHPSRISFKL